jgi:ribosomal protein L37E
MDGLQCKRCQEPDTFEVLCGECEAAVFGRTDRLIKRSQQAKDKAEEVCGKLGPMALKALTKLDDEVSEVELFAAFKRQEFTDSDTVLKYTLCLRLLQLEDEREGYAELAEMSARIPFDDKYLEDRIMEGIHRSFKHKQDWKNQ